MKIWEFSRTSGWLEIEDFLQNDLAGGDCNKEFEIAGYSRYPRTLGGEHCDFFTEIRVGDDSGGRAGNPYRYIVSIELAGTIETVAIREFPDLIELLAKLTPIAKASAWSADRENAELDANRSKEI